jgi:sulfur-oxidizing protein SoxY
VELDRRLFLQKAASCSLLAIASISGTFIPRIVLAAWPKNAFQHSEMLEVIGTLYGDTQPQASDKITIKSSRLAENGAVVPIKITADLPNVTHITLLAEKNPTPLVAHFSLNPRTIPFISTRIKLRESSKVIVLIKSDDQLFSAKKEIQVTIGGCGT